MVRSRLSRLAGSAALLFAGACAGLDVENPNNPDVTRALASGEDVKNIAISTMNSWYLTSTSWEPYMMLEVTIDARTANFGNFGMRFNNLEPRIAYENSSAGGDRDVTETPWGGNYSTLGAANDVLRALDNGVQIANGVENDKWRAIAAFTQAASLSNLSFMFDSAFIVDEDFDATAGAPTLSGYAAVNAAAMTKWDALIALLNGKSDDYASPTVLPTTEFVLTSTTLRQMANTMAAITLRMRERTEDALNALPASYWTSILGYADNGIQDDLTVQGDFNNWYSLFLYYAAMPSWTRVDYRLIKRMDEAGGQASAIPVRYGGTSDIRAPSNPTTNDQRLGDGSGSGDYRYRAAVIGDPGRGIWMQSAYSHDRYIGHAATSSTGARTAVPYILKAENDLLKAEAIIKSANAGRRAEAATLINNTRVGRGALAPVTALNTDAELLAAIDYERDVELLGTNGFVFGYARTSPVDSPLGVNTTGGGRIQPGTVRHLPIPAAELETLGKSVYTYGGVGNPDMMIVGRDGQLLPLNYPTKRLRPTELVFRR